MSPLVVKWLDRFNSPEGFTAQRWVSTKLGFPKNSYFSDLCIEYNLTEVACSFFHFQNFACFCFRREFPDPRLPFTGCQINPSLAPSPDSIPSREGFHQFLPRSHIIGARHNPETKGACDDPTCHYGLARFGLTLISFAQHGPLEIDSCRNTFYFLVAVTFLSSSSWSLSNIHSPSIASLHCLVFVKV